MRSCSGRPPTRRHGRGGRQLCGLRRNQDAEFVDKSLTKHTYLLANRYIDIMPKVAEQVAKPLTAVDSIKMYGSGNAQKLVKETTSIVDQVASGLKDSTGIDLPSLLNGLISNPDIDADSAENSVE